MVNYKICTVWTVTDVPWYIPLKTGDNYQFSSPGIHIRQKIHWPSAPFLFSHNVLLQIIIGCPDDWEPLLGACYFISSGYRSHKVASDYCKNNGGHLFSPTDQEASDVVWQAVYDKYVPHIQLFYLYNNNYNYNIHWIQTGGVSTKLILQSFL